MPAGILLRNNNNELVLSSEAPVYGYIGQATLNSVVQPYNLGGFWYSGYSTYTIYWPADIMIGIPLYSSPQTSSSIENKSFNAATGVWTIRVQRGNGLDSNGFLIQQACPVHVWGLPYAGSSPNWGVTLHNSAGSVIADLSKRPLVIKGSIVMPANTLNAVNPFSATTFGTITVASSRTATSVSGGALWNVTERSDTMYTVSGVIYRHMVSILKYTEDAPFNYTSIPETYIQILDLAGI